MFDILRLRRFGNRATLSFDPMGAVLRLDAAYRERRRMDQLTHEQLRDVGLTRADIERAFDRD